jgi:tripartite-type tricarboxylate transporter receptor subunit TctC
VAKAPPDGYTLLLHGSTIWLTPLLQDNVSYDPTRDFSPIALTNRSPNILVVHPAVPAKTAKELIALARSRPGQLNYGSSGVGSTHHLSMEALKASLGLQMTHVPFKGTSESVPALLGGHVDVAFSAYPSLSGAVGTKNITLLATNGAKRSAIAPDVPPVADWIPGYAFAPVIGVYARTGTPPAILQKIASEVAAIVKEPEIVKQFATAGIEPYSGGPAEYAVELKREDERVAKTVKAAGMTPQ